MDVLYLAQEDRRYPSVLRDYLSKNVPKRIAVTGNINILKNKTLAFFCFVKCPENLALQSLDLAQSL